MHNPEATPDSFLQRETDAHLALLHFIGRAPSRSILLPNPRDSSVDHNPYLVGFATALVEEIYDPTLGKQHLAQRTPHEALRDGAMFALAKLDGHAGYFRIPPCSTEAARQLAETEEMLVSQPLAALAYAACLFMDTCDSKDAYVAAKSEPVILLPADEQLPQEMQTPFQTALVKKVEDTARIAEGSTPAEACQQGIYLALGCLSLALERSANSFFN